MTMRKLCMMDIQKLLSFELFHEYIKVASDRLFQFNLKDAIMSCIRLDSSSLWHLAVVWFRLRSIHKLIELPTSDSVNYKINIDNLTMNVKKYLVIKVQKRSQSQSLLSN